MRHFQQVTTLIFICSTLLIHVRAFMFLPSEKCSPQGCWNTAVDDDSVQDEKIIHLNHAGASPPPSSVLNTVIEHLKLEQRLGGYTAEEMREAEVQQVYRDVARLLHASSSKEIALVESATVGWTRLFYAMADYQNIRQKGKKTILVSEADYAANIVAACQWARTQNDWTVLPIPSGQDGMVDMQAFRDMLNDHTAIVCVTHIPTNSGILNPVQEIGEAIAHYNEYARDKQTILYLVDACQSVGQMDVNVQLIQCHGLTGTGRKYLRGPRGTGFLYVPSAIDLIPTHVDHTCAPVTGVPSDYPSTNVEDWIGYSFQEGAKRFEFWESNISGKLGLGQAVRYALDKVGMQHIFHRCQILGYILIMRLSDMHGVYVHHDDRSSCGIVTFSVRGVDAKAVKDFLWIADDDCRLEVSVVPATSTPLDSARCNVPDLVRASLSYTNSIDDIEELCKRLEAICINPEVRF